MSEFIEHKSGLMVPASFAATSKRPEFREVATTRDGRDITRGYVDPMMIQQPLDTVLRLRGNGDYTIYQEVLRDDQVAACFNQRRLAVIGKEWGVEAGGTSRAEKKAAEYLEEQLNHFGWDRATNLMLFGVFYGYAAAEVMWGRDGNYITIDQIKVRDRRRFGFDGAGQLRLKTFSDPDGELLPPKKFWTFCTGADHDDEPYGLGLAHWLYWPVFFKRAGMRYWMTFLERFGQPTAKGEYPTGATPAERQKLLDALEAINTDSGIAIPQGMSIGFLEAARSGTADYAALYAHMDRAIAKMTLGQTASSEGTPGRLGNDQLQGDVRLDLIKADADLVCESFNRTVVRWATEYNFPGATPPRVFRKVQPDEDLTARAQRDKHIFDMGYRPTLGAIMADYGGEWEPVSRTPAAPASPSSFADEGPAKTLTDQLDDRLQSFTDQWINQIRELVNRAESLDQLRDGLATLLPDMKLEQYADVMAEALRLAELTGRDDLMSEAANAN